MRFAALIVFLTGSYVACAVVNPAIAVQSSNPAITVQSGDEQSQDTLRACVVRGKTVTLELAEKRGDSLVVGVPADHVFPRLPAPYGNQANWFQERKPILFKGATFYWNGTPLVFTPDMLARVGEYRGVTLFAAVEEEQSPGILLVPFGNGCELQPYYHFGNL